MYTFIDLFAGIGGFHLSLSQLGAKCVFASEIDKFSRITYEENFKKLDPDLFTSGNFNADILSVTPQEIPSFDILCAGFPCQPFSVIGQKKGFDENKKSRGNMFYILRDIIAHHRPQAIFLENVQNLKAHDSGKTFETIKDIVENELKYELHYKVVKASDYGLPQFRPRMFLVAFRKEDKFKSTFTFPENKPLKFTMSDVWGGSCEKEIGYTIRVGGRGSGINDKHNWDCYLVDGVEKQLDIPQCKKMMGFPDDFLFPVSKTQALKQLGNSVAVDAIKEVSLKILQHLNSKI